MPIEFWFRKFKSFCRAPRILTLVLLAVLTLALSWSRVFDIYEYTLLDIRYRSRSTLKTHKSITIVEISDKTLKTLGYWPIPRDFHATLLDVLRVNDVAQIIFDLVFTDASVHDKEFAQAISDHGNVYLPYVLNIKDETLGTSIPEADRKVAPIVKILKDAAEGTGHINSVSDVDGKTRRVPLVIREGAQLHPLITLKAACGRLGLPCESFDLTEKGLTVDGQLHIPTDENGMLLVNYVGPWETSYRFMSYVDILGAFKDEMERRPPRIDLDQLYQSICFIGLTATGTSDLRPIPYQNNYPMVGLHANVYNSILEGKYLRRASRLSNALILVVVALVVLFSCLFLKEKPFQALFLTLFYASQLFVAGFLVFAVWGIWIDLFYPMVVMFLIYAGVEVFHYLDENKRRVLMEKELSVAKTIQESFLPKDIGEFGDLQIAQYMSVAKHVGGDLYDYRVVDDETIGVLIGDVSGKGVGAALVMSKTITIFRMLVEEKLEPAALMEKLNEHLAKDLKPGIFVTATYLIYDVGSGEVRVTSAGHNATIHCHAKDGKIDKILLEEGLPLGLMKKGKYGQSVFRMEAGDKVALFSDGVSEARNVQKEEFGEDRLCDLLKSGKNAKETVDAVVGAIHSFSAGALQHDDCTLIVLSEKP